MIANKKGGCTRDVKYFVHFDKRIHTISLETDTVLLLTVDEL